jgi:DNA-binding IclR family transcriptional regulator
MTREADWSVLGGLPTLPRFAPALTILAQFDSEHAVLERAKIAWVTGCSGPVGQQCLVTLTELGYLTKVSRGAYRLAGGESHQVGPRHDDNGALDPAA